MHEELLVLFQKYLEKQDVLSEMTESEALHGYGYSEEHCIDAIGSIERPNVTRIAQHLGMTRSAISKIAKRMQAAGLVESYQLPDNRKEVYFRLTPAGQEVFDDHEARHNLWRARDEEFFARHSEEELAVIESFMRDFNDYLGERIEALGKHQ